MPGHLGVSGESHKRICGMRTYMPRALAVSLPWDWLSLLFPCLHLNIAPQKPDTNRQGRKMWLSLIDTVFLQEFSSWLIPVTRGSLSL